MQSESGANNHKSRTEKGENYPDRFYVPLDHHSWAIEWDEYTPPYFVDQHVLDQYRAEGVSGWADPEDLTHLQHNFTSFTGPISLDPSGRPLNPVGRTGIQGRGELGKWGANFAGDPIVTRIDPESHLLQIALIEREDCGERALPGGMAEKGENPQETLAREMREETTALLSFFNSPIVYQGYVDDRRNTDNAWIETTAAHLHLSALQGDNLKLQGRDDAKTAEWYTLTPDLLVTLYASHAELVRIALRRFLAQESKRVSERVLLQLQSLVQ